MLPCPKAPFDKSERKRALKSAIFYSECSVRGIKPVYADAAATNAAGQYEKWWVKTSAARQLCQIDEVVSFPRPSHPNKRRKISGSDSSVGVVTAGSASVASEALTRDDDGLVCTARNKRSLAISHISTFSPMVKGQVDIVKQRLIDDLKSSGGNVETNEFKDCLDILSTYYKSKSWDGRAISDASPFTLNGSWLALSKPTYAESKGRNEKGEYLYSLGRLSFDMFTPTSLACSIQGSFNFIRPIDPKSNIRPLYVPRKLMKEIHKGDADLRAYEYVYSFNTFPFHLTLILTPSHLLVSQYCGFSNHRGGPR